MSPTPYLDLARLATPEIILVLTALAVLTIDIVVTRELEPGLRRVIGSMFAIAGGGVAIAWMFAFPVDTEVGGMLATNGVTRIVKASIVALTVLTMLLNLNNQRAEHVGEHLALLLFSTTGMLLLVSSRDLSMVFVCLELSTVPLYALAAFDTHRKESAECGLKFFLFGAISTALTLFGFSLLYGLSGSSSLVVVARVLSSAQADALAVPAIVMVIAGIGFKVAAAPFHLWAPDVYEAAPVPAATFIASASKVAGFFALGLVLILGLGGKPVGGAIGAGWFISIGIVAVFSMVLGNLAALVQQNVRRLLAFSAVAHAGYTLLALLSASPESFAALTFYAVTYALSAVGAFTVAGAVQEDAGRCNLADFEGLAQRSPTLALCMLGFMLSLAGIPPLAGFMGKFYVFATLLGPGAADGWRLGLLLVAVGTSAISLYYYLQVLKSIYVRPQVSAAPLKVSIAVKVLLGLVAAAVFALGCYPEMLLKPLIGAAAGFH